MQHQQSSGLATASLVLGVVSVFGSCLTGVPAIICGHVALSKIKKSGGTVGGHGLALTGVILGYVMSLFGAVILAGLAVPTAMKALGKADEVTAINSAKELKAGLDLYAASNVGNYPTSLSDLVPTVYATRAELDEIANVKDASGSFSRFNYVPGFNQSSPSNAILLYSPSLKEGRRIIARVDSSVKALVNTDAKAELAAQGIAVP